MRSLVPVFALISVLNSVDCAFAASMEDVAKDLTGKMRFSSQPLQPPVDCADTAGLVEECRQALGEFDAVTNCCAASGNDAQACVDHLVNSSNDSRLQPLREAKGRMAGLTQQIAVEEAKARRGDGNTKAGCDLVKKSNEDVGLFSQAAAGACEGAKEKFVKECKHRYRGCPGPDVAKKIDEAVKNFSAQAARTNVGNANRGAFEAMQCGNLSSSDPKNPGGGGKSEGGDKDVAGGDGGGGKVGSGASRDGTGGSGGSKPQSNASNGMGNMLQSMLPMMMSMMGQQDQQQQQQFQPQVDKVDCSVNATLLGCECTLNPMGKDANGNPCPQAPKTDSWNKGEAQIASVEPTSNGEFNVGSDTSYKPSSNEGEPTKIEPQAAMAGAGVPNGGTPLGGGGGAAAASLGGGGNGGGGGGGPGANTNILNGFSGGGGGGLASVNSGMNMKNGEGGGGYSYGGGARLGTEDNVDLSSFFVGMGKNGAVGRQLAGASSLGMDAAQILSSKVNIWTRISERFKARCELGLLRDCGP